MLFPQLTLGLVASWVSGFAYAQPTTCNNAGLQYAAFTYSGGNDYDPSYMKDPSVGGQGNSSLIYNSSTTQLGNFQTPPYCYGNTSIYGGPSSVPCQKHSIMYRGYLYAPISGIYTVLVNDIDDFAYLWLNATARSGWNRDNAAMVARWARPWFTQTSSQDGSNATFIWITQGQYYPIRIVHSNVGGPTNAFFSILDPLGNPMIGSNTTTSPNVVQYPCNRTSAPPFTYDWGHEI